MNIFIYDSSQVNPYTITDYGSLSDSPTVLVDNGLAADDFIVESDYIVEDDLIIYPVATENYDTISFIDTAYPYGSINISNSTNSSATVVFVVKPEPIRLHQEAIVVRKQAWIGSGTLFEIANGLERIVAPWIGSSGPLRVSGSAETSRSHIYSEESIKTYDVDVSYGTIDSIIGSSIDNGFVHDLSIGDTDYGDILIDDNRYPYGTYKVSGATGTIIRTFGHQTAGKLTISGTANALFIEPIPQIYEIESKELFVVQGNSFNSFSKATYISSGTLFNVGEKKESATFFYNESSIELYSTDNYGDISSSGITNDFGSVTEPSSSEIDLGETRVGENQLPYGLFTLSGSATDIKLSYGQQSTLDIKISGRATTLFVEPPNQFYLLNPTALFNIAGAYSNLSFGKGVYTGSGNLFSIGDRIEKATFRYSSESIVYDNAPINYQTIDTIPSSIIDYGLVHESSIGDTNYGNILPTDNLPYGALRFTGGSVEKHIEKYVGSGNVSIDGGYTSVKFVSQGGETTTLFNISGGDVDSLVKVFTGIGTLFSIGDRTERAAYSYNSSSIISIGEPINYGDISGVPTLITDYGYVNVPNTSNEDFGSLAINLGDENPFGLFKINGSAICEFFPTFAWNGSGVLKIKEETPQAPNAAVRFRPWWRGVGGTTVFNSTIPDSFSRPYIGSGSLFNIGDKLESVLYDYNKSSIVIPTDPSDYGTITDQANSTIDYGQVNQSADSGEEDLGSIIISDIQYPLTGLFSITGTGKGQFIRGPYVVKEGGFDLTGTLVERQLDHYTVFDTIPVSGIGSTPRSRTFIASGSLFSIGDRVEKATYSYNESSVKTFSDETDYGNLSSVSTNNVDYGLVTTISSGDTDLGSIIDYDNVQPYGLFSVTGESSNRWIQVFTKVGSGSLFALVGTVESQTDRYPESTVLFTASGSVTQSFSKGNYSGSGSLFSVGDRVEKAIYSYNESSTAFTKVGLDYGFTSDYGDLNSISTLNIDYGSVNVITSDQTNYGGIITTTGSEYPFGLFKISGSATEPKKIANWVGSGQLFAAKGAAEAFSAQTPEDTFLYKFTGRAVEKHIENYVGTGNIKIKEETPLAPNAAVRFRPWWRSYGEIFVTGSAVEEFRGAYVGGLGLQLKVYTAAEGFEWRSYRPSPRYVNSVYGNIGGSALTSGVSITEKVNVYGYYGDDKDPGTSGSLFGIGGSAESATVSEVSTGLFGFSGTAPSKWNPAWTSRPDGSPRLSGTPGLQLRFNLFGNVDPTDNFKVSGTPDLKIRRIYNGSGTLFNFESATETFGFNPDLETGLFAIKGAGKTNFSLLNIGSGSLFAVGSGAESTVVNPEENTVLYRFNGSGTEKQSVTEIGSGSTSIDVSHEVLVARGYEGEGSLFGIGGDVDSVTQSESGGVVLFTVTGSANHSFTRISSATKAEITIDVDGDESLSKTFIGSGSLFNIGSLEERVTFSRTSTVLFKISGLATDIQFSRDFVGSGSLFGYTGAAESASVIPEVNTILYKFTGRSVEKQTDRYVSDGVFEFISGTSEESSTKSFVGRGSLFSVVSATESRAVSEENTILYSVSGNAVVKSANKHFGSGTEFISGVGDDSTTKVFTGSGSLFAVGNSAESRTISLESTQLFRTSGSATERFTRSTYEASGQTNISGEASDLKRTFGNQVFIYQTISGIADERQTDSYSGSGSLFGFKNAAIARSIDIETLVSTNLIKINGTSSSSVTRITETETVQINTYGESISKVQLFSPIRIFGTII